MRDLETNDEDEAGEAGPSTTRPEAGGGDEAHPPPPAAEDNFIDDTGVPLDERVDYGAELFEDEDDKDLRDDNDGYAEDEAEDEDDFDAMLRPNSKRGREDLEDDNKTQKEVDAFLSQLDIAYELDVELINRNKPAIHKLRMLKTVREKLSMKRLHDQLLEHNMLGHLERWLHPLDGGILPNTIIRSTMLELLGVLPIDCNNEVRRQQLKDSGLGRLIMFYYKLPDETAENKKRAKQLIDKWSRPMLASKRGALGEEERKMLEGRRARNEAQKKALQASQDVAEREREREEMEAGAAGGGRRGGLATAVNGEESQETYCYSTSC